MSASDRFAADASFGVAATAQDHAAEWLQREIISGRLRPGQRIVQNEVAARIGVSPIPVREALRRLEGEGRLTYRSRRGYHGATMTRTQMHTVFELRALLEDHAARTAVADLREADLSLMRSTADRCTAAIATGDTVAAVAGHWGFYAEVLGGERRAEVLRLVRQLWRITDAYAPLFYAAADGVEDVQRLRRSVLVAATRRDTDNVLAALGVHRRASLEVMSRFAEPD